MRWVMVVLVGTVRSATPRAADTLGRYMTREDENWQDPQWHQGPWHDSHDRDDPFQSREGEDEHFDPYPEQRRRPRYGPRRGGRH